MSLCCFLRNVELVEDRQRWSDASERRSIPNCDWNKWRWDVQRSTNSWDAIDPFSSRNDVPSGSNANWWQLEMDLMIAFAPFDLPPIYYITLINTCKYLCSNSDLPLMGANIIIITGWCKSNHDSRTGMMIIIISWNVLILPFDGWVAKRVWSDDCRCWAWWTVMCN